MIKYEFVPPEMDEENIIGILEEITNIYVYYYSLPPRYEKINFFEIFEKFKFLYNRGLLVIAKNNNNKIIGYIFACSIEDFEDFEKFDFEDNSLYIYDDVILPEYSGLNVKQNLFDLFIKNSKELDYKYIYNRSRKDVIEQICLLTNQGFRIFHKYYATTNGVTTERYLYEKKL